jgi:hypothetical protein
MATTASPPRIGSRLVPSSLLLPRIKNNARERNLAYFW